MLTFVEIVQYIMKLVDELIITNRWDADSKHKSQYSGIQYCRIKEIKFTEVWKIRGSLQN